MEKFKCDNLQQLEKHPVFKHFTKICTIPHETQHEKNMSDYLVTWAKEKGLSCIQDENLNVVIYKDASKGYEDCEPVMLQAHMDMVCQKRMDSDHDFSKDPINLKLEGDILSGTGETNIGADDGIGVSMILSVLENDEIEHPAIEALFTVEEESTFNGVKTVDPSLFTARYLINLDYYVDDQVLISGCGGVGVRIRLPISYDNTCGKEKRLFEVKIENLTGGHSGGDIHKARGNANELFWRALNYYENQMGAELVLIEGGTSGAAIPRETKGRILIEKEDEEKLMALTDDLQKAFSAEYQTTAPQLNISVRDMGDYDGEYIYHPSFKNLLKMVYLAPNGIMEMNGSIDIKGLVESSINQGIMRSDENFFDLIGEIRFMHLSSKKFIIDKLRMLADIFDAKLELFAPYPPWKYRRKSELRKLAIDTYRDIYGEKLKPIAVHAGIECGALVEKIPELDAISIGANCYYFHSINECVSISSVDKVYNFLLQILKNMKRKDI